MSPKPMMRRGGAARGGLPQGMAIKKGTFKRLIKFISAR